VLVSLRSYRSFGRSTKFYDRWDCRQLLPGHISKVNDRIATRNRNAAALMGRVHCNGELPYVHASMAQRGSASDTPTSRCHFPSTLKSVGLQTSVQLPRHALTFSQLSAIALIKFDSRSLRRNTHRLHAAPIFSLPDRLAQQRRPLPLEPRGSERFSPETGLFTWG